jgi:hypothetical protein
VSTFLFPTRSDWDTLAWKQFAEDSKGKGKIIQNSEEKQSLDGSGQR